jgi:hypothetical protein
MDENTLGFLLPNNMMQVLSRILGVKGLGHAWQDGPVTTNGSERPATEIDFVRFRVMLPPDFQQFTLED